MPKITLTRAQARLVDQLALDEYAIPGVILMENAGRSAANFIRARLTLEGQVAILCGGGNNGGDGYVVGRHLSNLGASVRCYALTDPARARSDAAVHLKIATKMGLVVHAFDDAGVSSAIDAWHRATLLVDAMLGTGSRGEVRAPLDQAIHAANAIRAAGAAHTVALDLPSGMDADDGTCAAATIQADFTVTFVAGKAGFRHPASTRHTGEVLVGDIGVPPSLVARIASGHTTTGRSD